MATWFSFTLERRLLMSLRIRVEEEEREEKKKSERVSERVSERRRETEAKLCNKLLAKNKKCKLHIYIETALFGRVNGGRWPRPYPA